MKKLIFYLLLLPFIFSCKKNEIADQDRPDYKLTEALAKYNDLLSGSANGWKGHLFPKGGGGYGFLFNFNGKNRVEMLADLSNTTGSKSMESSYRLKATTLPSIYFDTYSYIHLLADPDPEVNGGDPGWGLYSDFEFSIFQATADTIKLKGNLNGSTLVLVKASATEAAAYKAGNLNVLRQSVTSYLQAHPFNYLETDKSNVVGFNVDLGSKQLVMSYDSLGVLKKSTAGFAFSGINDLVLSRKIKIGNLEFDKIQLSEDKKSISIVNQGQKTTVKTSASPLFSFSQMLGVQFNSIVVPLEQNVTGSGADFNNIKDAVLASARGSLAEGSTFPELRMTFNKQEKSLLVDLIIEQSGQGFHTLYAFYYTVKGDSYTFEYGGPLNGNGTYLEKSFEPLTKALTTGSFKFDYENGRTELMGYGINSAKPAFKFIGYLR